MKDEFRSGAHPLGKMPFPTELEGTVSQYLLNPRGEVDGFLLDGRMVIKFPPHLARERIQVIKPKERVRANGYLEADKLLKGHVIANPATGRAIREIKPTPPERAGAVGAPSRHQRRMARVRGRWRLFDTDALADGRICRRRQ